MGCVSPCRANPTCCPGTLRLPYPGKLTIIRGRSEDEVQALCPRSFGNIGKLGCLQNQDRDSCTLVIASDEVIKSWGFPLELVLRHETAHCNGWGQNHWFARPWQAPTAEKPVPGPTFPIQTSGKRR